MSKKVGNYFNYFRNIPQLIREWKTIYWISFKRKCPVCKGTKLHFVEGRPKFSKWFCTECTCMGYVMPCKKCGYQHIIQTRYKSHIYKEYRLGKYKNDSVFYNECQKDYFKQQIKFHTQGLKEWKEMYNKWKKRKHKQVFYAQG